MLLSPGCFFPPSTPFSDDWDTAILYSPALRRVVSVPDSHSEFSELSADHPESRSFLREISTGFRLTQRLHLKW
eukprot:COSAG02_NODE_4801_length_4960_cov_3.266406_9_plen_73_part_01